MNEDEPTYYVVVRCADTMPYVFSEVVHCGRCGASCWADAHPAMLAYRLRCDGIRCTVCVREELPSPGA